MAELKLKLKSASLVQVGEGKWRVTATAQLIYAPADQVRPTADSKDFNSTSPLGPIEADDLRWYLERYYLWPSRLIRICVIAMQRNCNCCWKR